MTTTDVFRKRVTDCSGLIEFKYDDKYGNVDPYYHGNSKYSYLLYYNGDETTVHSIDEVMEAPFIDGQSLNSLGSKIVILD